MTTVRRVLLIGVLLGLVAAVSISVEDFTKQDEYNQAIQVLDYTSVLTWGEYTGHSVEELLINALDSGLTHVALSELELSFLDNKLEGFFKQESEVIACLGQNIQELRLAGQKGNVWIDAIADREVEAQNIYLYVASNERAEQLYVAAITKYGQQRVQKWNVNEDKVMIELKNSTSLPINGLGFDPEQVAYLKGLGFKIIPRPVNAGYLLEDSDALNEYYQYIANEIRADAIIFAGSSGIVGLPYGGGEDLLHITANQLQQNDRSGPLYGYVEMTKLKGDRRLAAALNYHLARVHSISSHEWEERYDILTASDNTISSVVERYMLAINDRSAHILYIRPFTKSVAFNQKYFKSLTQRLASKGYENGSISPMPVRASLPLWVLLLLTIGVGCALLLLFEQVFPNTNTLIWIMLGAGVAGTIGIVFFMPSVHMLLQKLIALAGALVFSVMAIIVSFKWLYRTYAKGVVNVIVRFIVAIAIALIGGLYVHASLATAPFLTAIEVFPLVKVALLAPSLMIAFILLIEENILKRVKEILHMNVKMYHVLFAGIGVLILGILLIRSGNNPLIAVSSLELKLRLWLQKTLTARPRFKEFAIGYPLLILAAWLQVKQKNLLIWLTAGVIGLASLINTFAHLHKPLWMAFLTTFNGVWSGIIVGILFIIVYEILERSGVLSLWGE